MQTAAPSPLSTETPLHSLLSTDVYPTLRPPSFVAASLAYRSRTLRFWRRGLDIAVGGPTAAMLAHLLRLTRRGLAYARLICSRTILPFCRRVMMMMMKGEKEKESIYVNQNLNDWVRLGIGCQGRLAVPPQLWYLNTPLLLMFILYCLRFRNN
jgi:hypothetical protein